MKKFPSYRQFDAMDCGPTCLQIISKFYGKIFSREYLRKKCHISVQGASALGICNGAESIGMRSLAVNVNYEKLEQSIPLPCIAYWRKAHFIVIYKVTNDKVFVSDPAHGLLTYTKENFLENWLHTTRVKDETQDGLLILLEPAPEFYEAEGVEEEHKAGLSFLIPYFKPYKKILFQLLLGLLLTSVIQLIAPFLTQSLVDYGINYQNVNFIYIVLAGQLMLFFSQTFIRVLRDWLLLNLSARINLTLLSDFLIKILKLPVTFFESKGAGDFVQRVEDHYRVENFLSSETLNIIFSIFSFIVFGIVLAFFNFFIFVFYLFGTVLYIMWVLRFIKRRAELEYKNFHQSVRNKNTLIQMISGIQEIKINNSEKKRRWEWEEIQVSKHRLSMRSLSLLHLQTNGGLFISELKNILITIFTAKLVIDGKLTLGTMLAIQYIIGQLNNPIRFFISFVQSLQDAKISLGRIQEVHHIDNEDETQQDDEALPDYKTLTINNLSFKYGGEGAPDILKNLNFEIPEGKVTAIVGSSGSGKTTLLKLLLKFYEPNRGEILIGKSSLKNINAGFWRSNCGVVMQNGFIFSDTILRNITESSPMGLVDKQKLREAVRIANLEDFIESLPAGYNTVIGSAGITLSGGQQQRILIARAVYKNPEFLIFDEATSSLDANNERVIMENLEKFFVGKTVLVIAHRLSTVKKADQIIVLEKGSIIETGTHTDLTFKKGSYFHLVKNQLELGN